MFVFCSNFSVPAKMLRSRGALNDLALTAHALFLTLLFPNNPPLAQSKLTRAWPCNCIRSHEDGCSGANPSHFGNHRAHAYRRSRCRSQWSSAGRRVFKTGAEKNNRGDRKGGQILIEDPRQLRGIKRPAGGAGHCDGHDHAHAQSFLLDILISANITISVIVLLVSMYITKPVEFSVFPTTLLLLTLFRLALNISSTRLILIQGNGGTRAAGQVIEAFGNFVVGGNYIIGVVIFLVMIAIQYVVINHGAVRISEVTARFTLDALPGKQMSIDADLNAGLIDEAEARKRRKQLATEAEFYGAMDGASRFTQRDAVASILITTINIVAGFLIGVFQHGMDLQRALQTYTVLTIGDGLVTVIPALMVSVSGGLIVTRASSDNQLGADMRRQVFSNPQPLMLSGGVLVAMAAFPGLPTHSISDSRLGRGLRRLADAPACRCTKTRWRRPRRPPAPAKDSLESVAQSGTAGGRSGTGTGEAGRWRTEFASAAPHRGHPQTDGGGLGYLVPPVRVTDNLQLKAGRVRRSAQGRGDGALRAGPELRAGHSRKFSQRAPGATTGRHRHARSRRSAFPPCGFPRAKPTRRAPRAITVVDAVSVLGTHLAEVIRRHAHELLSRQDTKKILDRVAEENPRVVEDLVPKLLPLATVQKVLQNLLRERVSIRDSVTICEALGEAAAMTKNPVLLTEYVRQAIRRLLVRPYLNQAGELPAYFVDPQLERTIEGAIEHHEQNSHLNLPPQKVRDIMERAARTVGSAETSVAAVTSAQSRFFLRQLIEGTLPNLSILSHNEIPPGVRVVSLGVIA